MNTPTNHLDDQIRTLVRTAATHPGPPSLDDIDREVGVTLAPTANSHHSYRWAAVAAVMLLTLTGALLITRNRQSVNTPTVPPPSTDTRPSLGIYVLPTTTPTGWQLVDISEQAGTVETPAATLYEVAARHGDDHAILMLSPPSTNTVGADPTGATDTDSASSVDAVADPQWTEPLYTTNGELSWMIDGQHVSLFVPGSNEGLARDIQAQLEATGSGTGLTPILAETSSYRITPIDNATAAPAASASLTYRDPAGSLIFVSLNRTSPNDIDVLLDPSIVSAPAVAQSLNPQSIAGSLVRDDITIRLLWPAADSSADGDPVVESFLDSFHIVTRHEWERTADTITNLIANQPTIASADVLDGTLTIHEGTTLAGVCFTTDTARSCRYTSTGNSEQPGQRFVTASLIVNGAWIYIRELSDEESKQPITTDVPDHSIARADTPIGDFIVLAPPSGIDEISLTIGEGATATTDQPARPLR